MALQATLPQRLTRHISPPSIAVLVFGAALAFVTVGPLVMIFYGSLLNDFP